MEEPTAETLDSAVPITELAAGRSVLVRGPAMSGKYDLLLQLLDTLADCVLLVSTSRQAAGARADFTEYGDGDCVAVVDCSNRVGRRDGDGDRLVRYASSPKNLTEIGVKFTDLVGTVRDEDVERAAVGVHSASELLMYWDTDRVYQFLRVLLAEAQGLDWPAVVVVDDDAATDRAVTTLTQPFDAVVTTQRGEEGRAFRYQGSKGGPTDWIAF